MINSAQPPRLTLNAADAQFADGQVRSGELVAEDSVEFGGLDKKHQLSTFGAHFVEVGVDAATAEVRIRRIGDLPRRD